MRSLTGDWTREASTIPLDYRGSFCIDQRHFYQLTSDFETIQFEFHTEWYLKLEVFHIGVVWSCLILADYHIYMSLF